MTNRHISVPSLQGWHQRFAPDRASLAGLRAFISDAGKSNALLRQVKTTLLVFDDRLYHCGNGAWRRMDRLDPALRPDPVSLAAAAAELLAGQDTPTAVMLLMPSQEFVTTTVVLPGVAREAVKPALQLQAETLLPGYEEPLVLAINPARQPDAREEIALWLPAARLDALFDAFADAGLSLVAVMPRIVAAAACGAAAQLEDSDSHTTTRIHWQNHALADWQQINRQDLEEAEFREQWQSAADKTHRPDLPQHGLGSGEQYVSLPVVADAAPDYCFFPAGARALRTMQQQQRRLRMAAVAGGIALLFGLVPYLLQSFEIWRLNTVLERQYTLATDARQDQAIVRDFETSWGVYTEFPRQRLDEVLFTLQGIISPDVLTSLELIEGRLQIEGESQDPQSLLRSLESHPMFTQVDFARATSNNRYAIELRLATADFPAYYTWHFPEQRQR